MKPYAIIIQAMLVAEAVNQGDQVGDSATQPPAATANSTSTKPMILASPTLPGRNTCIHQPINKAIGTVQAMVNKPHGLSRSALTTISANTASRMIMMQSTAIIASMPAVELISSRAI